MKKKISTVIAASMIATNISPVIEVYADEVVKEKAKIIEENVVSQAKIKPFTLSEYSNFEGYNAKFKVLRDEIKSISNNGGNYPSSFIENAIDGNMSTHWETNKENSSSFKNEVVVEFNDVESIDRIAYATRQDSAKGKGYPTKFEIYSSLTGNDEDFKLVSTGEHSVTGNMMEFKFDTITTKKVKFVFKEAHNNWASASEFWFYKEDKMMDKLNTLFTDSNMNEVSESFNSIDKLNELEEEAKKHPLYEDFKEDIDNAKILITKNKIEASVASTQKFNYYDNEEYSKLFKMPLSNIKSIKNNAGHWASQVINNAVDGNLDTYWETNSGNNGSFNNEVEVEFKNAVTLNRVVYGARKSDRKGFAQEFEIYGSKTSKGDTYELVATGKHDKTTGQVEAKFNPTEFKRLKFKFVKSDQNWATLNEISFYTQDKIFDQINNLFTDGSKYELKDEYKDADLINSLENQISDHPLRDLLVDNINIAKMLVNNDNEEKSTSSSIEVSEIAKSKNLAIYDEKYKIKTSEYKSVTNNGKHYHQSVLTKLYDNDKNTHWETGTPNSDTFKNEVVFTFNEIQEIEKIMMSSRKDAGHKGFPLEYEIYGSLSEDSNEYKLISKGSARNVLAEDTEIVIPKTKFKKLKFKFVTAYQNMAALSEMSFYKEDTTIKKLNSLFKDKLHTELSDDYKTMDKLNSLEKELNNHPLKDDYIQLIDLAKELLNGNTVSENKIITLSQRGDVNKQRDERRQIFAGGNLDLTGYYVMPGESVEVYVDADKNSILPKLVFAQVGVIDNNNKSNYKKSLSVGRNIVTAPEGTKGYAIYFENSALPGEQAYAPKVRVSGESLKSYPVYIDGKTDPKEYVEQVKNHKGENMTDVMGDRFLLSVKNSEAKIAYVDREKTPIDTVNAMEKLIKSFDKLSGYDINDQNPIHRPSNALYHYKATNGSGLFASNEYVHLDAGSARSMLSGDVQGWGFGHEFGHQIENKDMRLLEVTNNLYSIYLQKEFGKIERDLSGNQANVDKYFTFEGTKGFGGFEGDNFEYKFGLFERLLVITQITNYFGDEAYANAYRLLRENPSRYNSTGSYQAIITAMSESTGYDLSSHFEYYNYPVTDKTKEFTSKFKPLDKKIRYTTIDSYKKIEDNVETFNESTKAVIDSIKKEKDGFTLNISTSDENKGTIAYEIYRDGKFVGFNRTGVYKDNVDSSKEYEYEVVAYDYRANESIKSDVFNTSLIKPIIDTNPVITIGLNEEFNAKERITAKDADGNDLTDSVVVKSNNVDVTKRGEYEVVYSVVDSKGIEGSSTIKVNVVSESDYISDLTAKSETTGWGTIRPDKSINNGEIGLTRNGEIVTYSKGAGVHANSELVYDLTGKDYDYFESYIGVDQAMKENKSSSIIFKVLVDGEEKYNSTLMRSSNDQKYVRVNVKDAKELKLVVTDGGNGNTADHANWADAKLTTNNAKPVIDTKDKTYKLGEKVDFMAGVKADDVEDGDLTSKVQIVSNNYEEGKTGRFEVVYRVTDKDNNLVEKKSYVTVYEDFAVKKSKFGQFDNLDKYNEEFKLNISSVSNNGGNYPGNVIGNAIDGNTNTFWETNNQNSDTFKNEVIFDLGESKEISKIAYKSRNGGKGFAKKFEIYTSNEAEGNDFILAGKGEYTGHVNDAVEFNIAKTTARRVKFKFVEANQNWASIGEMSFYKEDTLVDKITNDLFTDSTKTEVNETYNTLDKLEALREEVKDHPAVKLFEEDLNKAEEIIRAKFPTLNVEEITYVKLKSDFDLMDGVSASDKEDGNLTSSVKVDKDKFNINRSGEYTLTYSVTDSNDNVTTKERKVVVYNESPYLSDLEWESAVSGWKSVNKDTAVNTNNKIKLNVNGEIKAFDKGIGAATNAEIVYNLDGNYDYFTTYLGTDKNYDHNSTTIRFKIFADGKEVYTSDVIRQNSKAEFVNLNVSGVTELKLVADDVDNNGLGDFASWGDTKLYSIDKLDITELEKAIEEAEKLDLNNYSNESVAALENAIAKAKDALEFDNQESIDFATQELKNVMSSLVEVDLNEVVNIPDKYLVKSIQEQLNKTGDITLGDMRSLTTLTLSGVENLAGMEYAINLETLSMDYNEVKDLRPLANLKKLKNLDANEQFITGGELTPSNGKVVADTKVYNKKGENVAKTVRLVDKFGATVIEKNAEEEFVIDTTGLKEGYYGVHVLFEDEGFNGMVFYLFNI